MKTHPYQQHTDSICLSYDGDVLDTEKSSKNISSSLLRYWWNSSNGRKPIYWRKREVLEEQKHNGGMGMKNLTNDYHESMNPFQTSLEDKPK